MRGSAIGQAARGFTLLELIVTMVILGILSAIAMGRLTQSEVDATWFADEVRATVRLAQKQAIAQRTRILVVVAGNQLSLCYENPPASLTCGTALADLRTGGAVALSAPNGVALSASTSPFAFNGLGQPSSAVTLNVGGTAVQVTAETGYVF